MRGQDKVTALWWYSQFLCIDHHFRNFDYVNKPFKLSMVSEHVAGKARYGLCPIWRGGHTCHVGQLNFTNASVKTWDLLVQTARRVDSIISADGFCPTAYRSNCGFGINLHIVWRSPQDAQDVRGYFKGVLATCALTAGVGGVENGRVEIFPKEDHVPTDGRGSMIELPCYGASECLWK